MNRDAPPYSVIGVSLNHEERDAVAKEADRTGSHRSEVIKQALKYWMWLDSDVRDVAILQAERRGSEK